MMDRDQNTNTLDFDGLGNKIMLAIVLLIPLGFASLGGWFIFDGIRFAASADKLEATVIDKGRIARDNGDLFRPLFRFETPEGDTREVLAHGSDSDYEFDLGSVVTVLYNPDHPDQVRPYGFWLQYGMWSIFLGLGLFVFVVFAWAIGKVLRQVRAARSMP